MRWLYHAVAGDLAGPLVDAMAGKLPGGALAPESLAREGFVHCSYRDAVLESARLYMPGAIGLRVVQIDPRRLGVPVRVEETPRGPMPHVFGAIPHAAIAAVLEPADVETAPDQIDD